MSEKMREYLYYFEDIIKAISKIESYVSNVTYDEFCERPMIVDAVIRNFEIIGEAANKIPKKVRKKYPQVEWRETIGFRNVLIHNYFEVDVESVWDTVYKNIPLLKQHINKAFNSEVSKSKNSK